MTAEKSVAQEINIMSTNDRNVEPIAFSVVSLMTNIENETLQMYILPYKTI